MTDLVLTTLLGWLGKNTQREQKKLCNRSCDNTTIIRHSKKLCFWKNHKEVFNWLNFASWAEERSREKSRDV